MARTITEKILIGTCVAGLTMICARGVRLAVVGLHLGWRRLRKREKSAGTADPPFRNGHGVSN